MFNTFCAQRYNHQPYDLSHNNFGFKHTNGSDISAHLPFLEFLARQCNHITEFGARYCYSTCAFIKGCRGKVVSYDIQNYPPIEELKNMKLPCKWEFIQADTSKLESIEETDLLFIDTLHTYNQVKKELLHVNKVKKYLGFHDTYSQGKFSLDVPNEPGIIQAILELPPEWKLVYNVDFNHGLSIYQREIV